MSPLIPLIGTRLVYGLGTLFVISLVVFFAVTLLPGDVAEQILGRDATPESLALLRERLGLGQPGILRYLDWLGGMLTGEMGNSLVTGKDISELISARMANTLFLAAFAAAVAIPLALGLGVLAALYRDSLFDRTLNVLTLAAISLPEFFIAYILVMLLSIGVQVHLAAPFAVAALLVLPAILREAWRQRSQGAMRLAVAVALLLVLLNGVFHVVPLTVPPVRLLPSLSRIPEDATFQVRIWNSILPMLTLLMVTTAYTMRMTRASIVNLLALPYIEMAALKGASPARVILWHALPNALAPIVNVVALTLAYLVTGVVVVEAVFVYPGLGQLLVDAVSKRDIATVQACCLIFAGAYVVLNLLADVFTIASNPRLLHPR